MKNIMITLVLFMLMISSSYAQPSWHIITVDSEGWEGYFTSLYLDSLNRPHIVYTKWYNPNGKDLKYAYYDGNNWNISVILHSDDNYLDECSIAIDSNNYSHLSFYNYEAPNANVYYANNISGNWQITNVDQYGRFTAIAVDALNHPHIAYQQTEIDDFKYAHFNGSNWILETIDTLYGSGQGDNNSITTDSQNNPHISYCQDALGQLRYIHFNGTTWILEYPDGTAPGSYGNSTSICLDSSGQPHISHCEPLRYCSKASGSWQTQQIDSTGQTISTSLALDSNYYPHIAYQNFSQNELRMAHWSGSSWNIETVDPTPNAGFYCSLELDSEDRPHIAYMIGGNTDDLMYAWYGEGSLGVNLQSFTAQPTHNGIKLCWQAENSGPATLAGFNLYRIDLNKDPDKKYVQLNQNLITGNSPYTFLDSRINAGVNYQYRLWATYTDGSREEVGTAECSNSSIQPAAFSLLSVYPNPTKSLLTCRVSLSQPSEVNLSLYDISGRLVLAKRNAVPSGEQDLSVGLGKLAKGIYTVQVESGGVVQSKRIVVMR